MAFSYYIYYRVSQPARALTLVGEIQSALKSRWGVAGRLLRKRDDATTWMEIYEGVQDAEGFERDLVLAVRAAHFPAVLEPGGDRHMECFQE